MLFAPTGESRLTAKAQRRRSRSLQRIVSVAVICYWLGHAVRGIPRRAHRGGDSFVERRIERWIEWGGRNQCEPGQWEDQGAPRWLEFPHMNQPTARRVATPTGMALKQMADVLLR